MESDSDSIQQEESESGTVEEDVPENSTTTQEESPRESIINVPEPELVDVPEVTEAPNEPEYLPENLTDEEIENLLWRAKYLDIDTANSSAQPRFSTFALPKNLTNELEAIYKAGTNIKSQIDKLYSGMPTSVGELRNQIAEVSNFVMRQDRWIVLRIDALADVVADQNTKISNVSSRATYAKDLIDHLGGTVVPNVSAIAKNALSIAEYSKNLVDHIGNTVIPGLVEKDNYQAGQISTLSERSNTNKSDISIIRGVADYAKSTVDHIGGNVIPNLVEKDNYQAGQISTLSDRSNKNKSDISIISGVADYAKSTVDHIGGTVIPSLVEKDNYQADQISTISKRSLATDVLLTYVAGTVVDNLNGKIDSNTKSLVGVKSTADYAKSTVDHIGGTVVPNLVEKDNYQAGQITTISERSTKNKEDIALVKSTADYSKSTVDHLGGTVVPNILSIASDQQKQINALQTAVNGIKDYTLLLTTLNASTLLNLDAINSVKDVFKIGTNENWIHGSDSTFIQFLKKSFRATTDLFKVAEWTNKISADDGAFVGMLKHQFRYLAESFSASLKSVTDSINGIKDYTVLLTGMNANQLLNTVAINDYAEETNENFKTSFVGIEGLKNAINASKYDDNSFKTYINGRFSAYFTVASNFENGIESSDGIFSKLIKGQITRLMNDNFFNLEVFNKALTDNLRAEFKLLNDWFSLVVEWLDMIYTKPVAVFESAVFDFDRLQEMLDGISFGNVVNEAGTNLWDVLQELISALGGVVESILNIVPELIDQLIALIIPENPNFFSDDISALIDSFDSKFEWTGTLTNTFSSVFSQPKSIKSLTVAIAGKQYKVVPDFVDLGLIKTILTGYFCFLTVLTTYRRIVGSGDIVQ